jgi:uncharacterized protein with HEPN domain
MQPSTREYLQHILDEAKFLLDRSVNVDRDSFLRDEVLKRAFARSIEIIGEAVKQIPDSIRQQYPNVEWHAIAGMQNRLIHVYYAVDYTFVWNAVVNHVPSLVENIELILMRDDV